jgi:NADH-quinone oxidoreductase subunit F
LHRLNGASSAADVTAEVVLMQDLAQVMTDASICGLGQTAASAVQSAVRKLQLYSARPGR